MIRSEVDGEGHSKRGKSVRESVRVLCARIDSFDSLGRYAEIIHDRLLSILS